MCFEQGADVIAVARAVAEENARAAPVYISGATGPKAEFINGYFLPTEEKGLDGRVMYSKRGDGSMCIEHLRGQWQIKPVSSKGTAACYASVAGGCPFENCTSRLWNVLIENKSTNQLNMKMSTGADAELQVSGAAACARMMTMPGHFHVARLLFESAF